MKKANKPLKAVVDTSVLISAFAFGGVPSQVVKDIKQRSKIYLSHPLLQEYREVPLTLERKGKITREQVKLLLFGIASFLDNAICLSPKQKITLCRDPEDDMLLECCAEAKADLLITGDQDLLDLSRQELVSAHLGNLHILNPRNYIKQYINEQS